MLRNLLYGSGQESVKLLFLAKKLADLLTVFLSTSHSFKAQAIKSESSEASAEVVLSLRQSVETCSHISSPFSAKSYLMGKFASVNQFSSIQVTSQYCCGMIKTVWNSWWITGGGWGWQTLGCRQFAGVWNIPTRCSGLVSRKAESRIRYATVFWYRQTFCVGVPGCVWENNISRHDVRGYFSDSVPDYKGGPIPVSCLLLFTSVRGR